MHRHPLRPRSLPGATTCLLGLVAALAFFPAHAQYKVIGPDGKVTYTDRAPATASGNKVTSIGTRSGAATDAALPLELRQPVARYPVLLYVASGTCEPCDSARQLLRQRGIPYAEKQVQNQDDSEALERLTGGRDAPTLAIGSQILRGFAPEVWQSYLDAAGYPRESHLPDNFQYPAATPMTERRDATRTTAQRGAQPADPAAATAPQAAPQPAIKF